MTAINEAESSSPAIDPADSGQWTAKLREGMVIGVAA